MVITDRGKMYRELSEIVIAFRRLVKIASLNRLVLPKGTKIYHGTINKYVPSIDESGSLRGVWTEEDAAGKTSAGGLDEAGLIWFAPDIEVASSYAMGQEARGEFEPGRVYVVETNKDLVLADRYGTLGTEEAAILARINNRQHYAPIEEGTYLSEAVDNLSLWADDKKIWKHVLPLLGLDGIHIDEEQYGIVADEIPVSYSYPAREIWKEEKSPQQLRREQQEEQRKAEDERKAKEKLEREERSKALWESMAPEEQKQIEELTDLIMTL